ADEEIGMADLAVRARHAHDLVRSERLLVEIDGSGGAVHDEVRGGSSVAFRNRFDFGCHEILLVMGSLELSGLIVPGTALHTFLQPEDRLPRARKMHALRRSQDSRRKQCIHCWQVAGEPGTNNLS